MLQEIERSLNTAQVLSANHHLAPSASDAEATLPTATMKHKDLALRRRPAGLVAIDEQSGFHKHGGGSAAKDLPPVARGIMASHGSMPRMSLHLDRHAHGQDRGSSEDVPDAADDSTRLYEVSAWAALRRHAGGGSPWVDQLDLLTSRSLHACCGHGSMPCTAMRPPASWTVGDSLQGSYQVRAANCSACEGTLRLWSDALTLTLAMPACRWTSSTAACSTSRAFRTCRQSCSCAPAAWQAAHSPWNPPPKRPESWLQHGVCSVPSPVCG